MNIIHVYTAGHLNHLTDILLHHQINILAGILFLRNLPASWFFRKPYKLIYYTDYLSLCFFTNLCKVYHKFLWTMQMQQCKHHMIYYTGTYMASINHFDVDPYHIQYSYIGFRFTFNNVSAFPVELQICSNIHVHIKI